MRPEAMLCHLPKMHCIGAENSSEGGIPVKAVQTHGQGGPEQLFFEDAPVPLVRPGDVLVRYARRASRPPPSSRQACGEPRVKATQHPARAGGGTASFGADRLTGAVRTRASRRGANRADLRRRRRGGNSGNATGTVARGPRTGHGIRVRRVANDRRLAWKRTPAVLAWARHSAKFFRVPSNISVQQLREVVRVREELSIDGI